MSNKNLINDILNYLKTNKKAIKRLNTFNQGYSVLAVGLINFFDDLTEYEQRHFLLSTLASPDGVPICDFLAERNLSYNQPYFRDTPTQSLQNNYINYESDGDYGEIDCTDFRDSFYTDVDKKTFIADLEGVDQPYDVIREGVILFNKFKRMVDHISHEVENLLIEKNLINFIQGLKDYSAPAEAPDTISGTLYTTLCNCIEQGMEFEKIQTILNNKYNEIYVH